MPATAAAAVTSAQMVLRVEYYQPLLIEVEVAGLSKPRPAGCALAPERRYATLADARLVQQLRRYLREQFMGNLHLRAPAGAFVGIRGAKLAVVEMPA